MKKIFESELNGWNESAERIHIYVLENDDEYWEFEDMTHKEKCEYFNVFDETGYAVLPGATYHTYDFHSTVNHIVMIETIALNV